MNFEVNIWDQLGDNPMIVCYTSVRLPFRVSGTSSTLRCNGGIGLSSVPAEESDWAIIQA